MNNSKMTNPDFQKTREQISFVHSGYPVNCISPNLMTIEGAEEFPAFGGTGFFARRGTDVYYITARHCLTKDQKIDPAKQAELAGRLLIPYTLTDSTRTTSDFVQFDEVITIKHNSDEIPGEFVDVLVLTVKKPKKDTLYEKLLSRAAKLPPTGEWLDSFVQHEMAREAFDSGKGIKLSGLGYPVTGTATKVEYPEGKPLEILTQSAKFTGHLAEGSGMDRFKLNDVSWDTDLNGFSGSPVFVGFRSENGPQYALAGMLVSGGPKMAQFLKVSLIMEAFKN